MKKILLILMIAGVGYYYFQGDGTSPQRVSEVINNSLSSDSDIIKVSGIVKHNFKLFYGAYELEDANTGESIMVSTKGDVPEVGSSITKKLRRNDVITLNDKTFSLFEEVP